VTEHAAAPRRANRALMRAMNKKLVLDVVRSCETVCQADLARATKLSTGTIVSMARELRDQGLVAEAGQGQSTGGRKPTLLTLNPSAAFALACRVGSETATVALMDLAGHILQRDDLPFEPRRGPDAFLADLATFVTGQLRSLRLARRRIAGMGLSLHGPVDTESGRLLLSRHLGWRDVPFKEYLEGKLRVPVHVEAETRAMALAEQRRGSARDVRSFVMVEVDTGIGMVQVLDGGTVRGSHSMAGELGYTVWWPAAPTGPDRPPVVLEDVASIGAMCREAQEGLAAGRTSGMRNPSEAASLDEAFTWLVDAHRKGDELAAEVIHRAAHALAAAVANLVNLLDPELVLLAGCAINRLGEALTGPIRTYADQYLLDTENRTARIEAASLGTDAALIGAGTLVYDRFFSVENLLNTSAFSS